MVGVMPAGIGLDAAIMGSPQGIVIVERKHVHLIVVRVAAVEIQVEVVHVVPIVVPMPQGNIGRIHLQQQIHIARALDPVIEFRAFERIELRDEILQLSLRRWKYSL